MGSMQTMDSCQSCRFFTVGERMGLCKRYPQSLNKSTEDWCGEWDYPKNHVIEAITSGLTVTFSEEQPKKKPGRPRKP